MKTGNPTLYDSYFRERPLAGEAVATVQGTAIKTLLLLAIMSLTFAYTWHLCTLGYSSEFAPDTGGKLPDQIDIPAAAIGWTVFGVLGGFVTAMVIIFFQRSAPFLAPVYAALEGLALGAISAGFEARYPGIVMEAMAGVIGTMFLMLVIYSTGLIKPTQGLLVGLLIAMGGIILVYLADNIMMYFGSYISVVHSAGPWGIALSAVIVIVAALNLIFDFATVSEYVEQRAPRRMEWYGAFSLMVTLVWLYLEILRLLAKIKSSND